MSRRKIIKRTILTLLISVGLIATFQISKVAISVIYGKKRGIPFDVCVEIRNLRIVGGLTKIEEKKYEGKDADYMYVFEYSNDISEIMSEYEKQNDWSLFPVDQRVLCARYTFNYGGYVCIPYGMSDSFDELPFTDEDFNGLWVYMGKEGKRGSANVLMIDDKTNQRLYYAECDY